ncbi:MAG: RiPP maturation radical SAM C-methyltransferase [Kiritimatiellae bacterium]|nr:RiPP maturation radical SAM C-methyltransferase [Kiritimatiellia bacterium]
MTRRWKTLTESSSEKRMADIVLAAMPYAVIEHPSLALGLLKAELTREGLDAVTCNEWLYFVEKIGFNAYILVSNCSTTDQLGEWTFAGAAFPDFKPNHDDYIRNLDFPVEHEKWFEIRRRAKLFVDEAAGRILEHNPRIVGCSSVFQQHCASLALLRRIRELAPEVATVMGGANCEGSMGRVTHEAFTWVDFVVSGEADETFPLLCRQVLENGRQADPALLPTGVLGPRDRSVRPSRDPGRSVINDMNTLPEPDYSDYFADLRRTRLEVYTRPGLMMETSRGCWWGQKRQCTFCGLNGHGMQFRIKKPDRALSEISNLSKRYGINRITMADNILSMDYVRSLLPVLAADSCKYLFAYETKANMRREHMRTMAAAGIHWIQPGIESMHPEVLSLLRKGTTVCTNIELLKWAREFGIFVLWNFLAFVPGEKDEWYDEMAEWLPLLSHLNPPTRPAVTTLRFDRFSAYFQDPGSFNLKLEPYADYSQVYPLSPQQILDLAYFFRSENVPNSDNNHTERNGTNRLNRVLAEWREVFWGKLNAVTGSDFQNTCPVLTMRDDNRRIRIRDTRPVAVQADIELQGTAAVVYRACDRAQKPESLQRIVDENSPVPAPPDALQQVINSLIEMKIMLQVDGRLLSLAVREPACLYPPYEDYPGGSMAPYLSMLQADTEPDNISVFQAYGLRIDDDTDPGCDGQAAGIQG